MVLLNPCPEGGVLGQQLYRVFAGEIGKLLGVGDVICGQDKLRCGVRSEFWQGLAVEPPARLPEMQEIRGVNCAGVIKTLLERRLITTAGRKDVIGRPILYRTSKDFLVRFGLSDLEELPSLKEFEQLAREALGSDEGIAPVEPDEAAALNGAAEAAPVASPAPAAVEGTDKDASPADEPNGMAAPPCCSARRR